MRGFDHATILSPSFHGLRKERLVQWPAFCAPKFDQKFRGYFQKNWMGVCCTLQETLTLFQTKICDLPYPISDLKPWSPARDRSAWQAVRYVPRQRYGFLAVLVWNRVWFVHSSYDLVLNWVCFLEDLATSSSFGDKTFSLLMFNPATVYVPLHSLSKELPPPPPPTRAKNVFTQARLIR